MSADAYAVLELASDATDEEIKQAFRRLAALYHPDRNPGFQAAATERLKELNAAHDAIRAARRARPDSGPRTSGHTEPEPEDRAERPAEPEPQPDDRALIAAALKRAGLLAPGVSAGDSVAVEALATLMPHGSRIAICASYSEFSASGSHPFREARASFLRPSPAPNLGGFMGARMAGDTSAISRTRVVLCTQDEFLWTTSSIAAADPLLSEETIAAYSMPLADLLGATARRKGVVEVWVHEGPTLTFRVTPPRAATDLAAFLEHASELA